MPTFPTKNEIVKENSSNTVDVDVDVDDDVETETEEEEEEEEVEQKEEETEKKEDEEEEEEELFEVEINGVMYVCSDDEDGNIYSYIDEEVGDKVGMFKGKIANIFEGKNKGIYDRTKCKFDF
jgi:hypothetical protein